MSLDDSTREAAGDLLEALQPLDARTRAMFGGYCFYLSWAIGLSALVAAVGGRRGWPGFRVRWLAGRC